MTRFSICLWEPILLVKEHTDEGEIRKIIVEDNGIGMDDHVIENYFMRIGKSYYQSRDFKKESIQFSPISVFGIGILSCFMMADRIEVDTLKEGKAPRKVEIENYSDYFVTRSGSRTEPGTTIHRTGNYHNAFSERRC
jgi:HSP90 family molecular chaperone